MSLSLSLQAASHVEVELQCRLFQNSVSLRLRLVQDMNAHPIWGVEPDPRDRTRVATHNIGWGEQFEETMVTTFAFKVAASTRPLRAISTVIAIRTL